MKHSGNKSIYKDFVCEVCSGFSARKLSIRYKFMKQSERKHSNLENEILQNEISKPRFFENKTLGKDISEPVSEKGRSLVLRRETSISRGQMYLVTLVD